MFAQFEMSSLVKTLFEDDFTVINCEPNGFCLLFWID